MSRSTKILLTVVLCVGWIALNLLTPIGAAAADKPIPLHIAIQKGLVEVDVLGRVRRPATPFRSVSGASAASMPRSPSNRGRSFSRRPAPRNPWCWRA